MKYCYGCGRITAGEPLFCQFCGRTYDVKLCPRMHANPRVAEVCSQCGSRDFSTPQPRVSPMWRALGFVGRVIIGSLLAYVVIAGLIELFTSPKALNALLSLAFLGIALWVLWGMLPNWLRKIATWSVKKGGGRQSS